MARYNDKELNEIIRPLPRAVYEVDCGLNRVEQMLDSLGKDYGGLDLNPDYQRGHVWTPDQQRHFVENVLRGVVTSAGMTVQLNCPNWEHDATNGDLPRGIQCIDGLQRITAIRAFLAEEVRPFGLTLSDLSGTVFDPRRASFRVHIAMYCFTTKADVLAHYLAINAGGTPHTQQEIERIRMMLTMSPDRPLSARSRRGERE